MKTCSLKGGARAVAGTEYTNVPFQRKCWSGDKVTASEDDEQVRLISSGPTCRGCGAPDMPERKKKTKTSQDPARRVARQNSSLHIQFTGLRFKLTQYYSSILSSIS